jgi:hypothetical protein
MSKRMIDILIRPNPVVSGGLQQAIRDAEVFIVDNVTKYFFEDMDLPSKWWSADFPNCAPPNKTFWMETRAPQFSNDVGHATAWQLGYAWGAVFFVTDLDDATPDHRKKVYEGFLLHQHNVNVFTWDEFAEAKWWVTVVPMWQRYTNPDSMQHFNLMGHYFIKANGEMMVKTFREGTQQFADILLTGERSGKTPTARIPGRIARGSQLTWTKSTPTRAMRTLRVSSICGWACVTSCSIRSGWQFRSCIAKT